MRVEKKIINFDSGGVIVCCWDECDATAYECYRHTSCEHDVTNLSCRRADEMALTYGGRTAHTEYRFCSQRHRNYWVNATGRNALESIARTGRAYGNLPVGLRGMIG